MADVILNSPPFGLILTSIHFGGNHIGVLTLRGFSLNVFVYDKDGNQTDGGANFFPTKRSEIEGLRVTGLPFEGATMISPMHGFGNFSYVGRAIADDGGSLFAISSISWFSIAPDFPEEFMTSNFIIQDGVLISYAQQRDRWLATYGGYRVIITTRKENADSYTLQYTAVGETLPDYIDLFQVSLLIKFSDNAKTVKVALAGAPHDPITCIAEMKAYSPTSVFVARDGGTVDAFTDIDMHEIAEPAWEASGSMSALGDFVTFDNKGRV